MWFKHRIILSKGRINRSVLVNLFTNIYLINIWKD